VVGLSSTGAGGWSQQYQILADENTTSANPKQMAPRRLNRQPDFVTLLEGAVGSRSSREVSDSGLNCFSICQPPEFGQINFQQYSRLMVLSNKLHQLVLRREFAFEPW
jgi:hypothetical protein